MLIDSLFILNDIILSNIKIVPTIKVLKCGITYLMIPLIVKIFLNLKNVLRRISHTLRDCITLLFIVYDLKPPIDSYVVYGNCLQKCKCI